MLGLPTRRSAFKDETAGNTVTALVEVGGTVYAGGSFLNAGAGTTGGGSPIPRNRLAAFNADGGNLLTWNPSASGPVQALVVHSGVVYVGGTFGTLGGQLRTNIGAVDGVIGNANSFNPGADNTVYAANGRTRPRSTVTAMHANTDASHAMKATAYTRSVVRP